jgi:Icc-related predicted phosphoesterase
MKVLAVSDQVDPRLYNPAVKANLPGVELILGCGDLPAHYLDFLASTLSAPLFYVAGNHDAWLTDPAPGEQHRSFGGTDLDAQVFSYQRLLIGGLAGSMRYNRDAGSQYTDQEMARKASRMIPRLLWNRLRYGRYLDVLITHAPPKGIHDTSDLCHTGFNALLRFMDRFEPQYLLHGHVHRYNPGEPAETRYGRTQVINVYPYRLLDLYPL